MMGVIHSLSGSLRVELTSADIMNSLKRMNEMQIPIWNLEINGDLTAQFTVLRRCWRDIQKIAERDGEKLTVLSREGVFWELLRIAKRPVIVSGLCLILILGLLLPGRVLFVKVEGNEKIPERLILEAAREVGIGFGVSRRAVRSEKVKNQLMDTLPQLQWAGVNTYGCTAVISVRERTIEEQGNRGNMVSNVVASRDGIITSCTITTGEALCKEGQAVKKGQMLISGYADYGGVVTASRGQGEIFARTRHEITAVSPLERRVRSRATAKQVRYSLFIGKKRINFYKGSGISDGSCVKMVSQYHLALPGNYELPLVLLKEETCAYQQARRQTDGQEETEQLSEFSRTLIKADAIALSVTDAKESFERKNGLLVLNGIYSCTEMIGREQGVQIGDFHGKTD